MSFYAYVSSGEIKKILLMDRETAERQLQDGELLGEGDANDATQWVQNGAIASRPQTTILTTTMPADGAERLVAADLPLGTVLSIDFGSPVEVLDGELLWVPTEPGRWHVRLQPPFPWRETEFEVVVHEISVA